MIAITDHVPFRWSDMEHTVRRVGSVYEIFHDGKYEAAFKVVTYPHDGKLVREFQIAFDNPSDELSFSPRSSIWEDVCEAALQALVEHEILSEVPPKGG